MQSCMILLYFSVVPKGAFRFSGHLDSVCDGVEMGGLSVPGKKAGAAEL